MVRTKRGPGVHGPPVLDRSVDHLLRTWSMVTFSGFPTPKTKKLKKEK